MSVTIVGPAETRWVIVCAGYFDHVRDDSWASHIMLLGRELSQRLGVDFTHFGVEPRTSERGSLRQDYAYRWIPRSVTRLEELVLQRGLLGLELIALADPRNDYMIHGVLTLGVRTQRPYRPNGYVYSQVASNFLQRSGVGAAELCCRVLQRVERIADMRYGFIQPMILGKFPGGFVSGLGGSLTTPLEAHDNALWIRFHDNYDSEVRNLYWGNVITDKHCLRPFNETLEELRRIVGEENVLPLSEDKAFFILPIEMSEIENRDDCQRYHEIRQQVASFLRFMVPDEFVEKVTESAARTSEHLRSVSHDDSW